MDEAEYINKSHLSEEDLAFYANHWFPIEEFAELRTALMAESVDMLAIFSAMHFKKGTELIISVPVRIKF